VIPLTPPNHAPIAQQGTLELGSTWLQATEVAVAVIVVLGFGAVLAWQFMSWGHRRVMRFMETADPCPCCPENPAAHPDCTCREPCGWEQCPAAEDTDELDVPEWMKDSRG
jgi:hypothetical protein